MSKQTIPTSMAPEVIIEQVHGELQIRGWERPEVLVSANSDDLSMEEQDDTVRLSCQGNCDVRLPHGATLQIGRAHANTAIKNLHDQIDIDEIDGSLNLREVAGMQIERVHGELYIRSASDNLRVGRVDGNASIRDLRADCVLEQIDGNLDLHDVGGRIQAQASGNARLHLSQMSGDAYQVRADGNLHCHIPPDASCKLTLSSDSELIRLRLPEVSETYQQAQYELSIGGGAALVSLSAGGSLYLFSDQSAWSKREELEFDFEGLSEEFNQQISQQIQDQIQSQMDQMTRHLNDQMAHLSDRINRSGLSQQEAERIVEQALAASERETLRAQEKLRRAQEKLERKLEANRMRAQAAADRRTRAYGRGSWSFTAPTSPPPPAEPRVSDEERLMILRMLEQKKITPAEADQLLAALEGKE
jgi:DUF4097 and DUF4098 domain-containing protein YvlB